MRPLLILIVAVFVAQYASAQTYRGWSEGRTVSVRPAIAPGPPVAGTLGGIWVEPRGGWRVPTTDLGRTDVIAGTGYGIFEMAEQSIVFGLAAGFEAGAGLALRISVLRSPEKAVHGEWKCVPFIACLAVLLPLDGDLSAWTGAIDVLYRLPMQLALEPVVFAGAGFRRSRLDWSQPAADVTLPGFSFKETVPIYRFGGGVGYAVGAATVFAEVEAVAARFGGGSYESIEGSVEADRELSVDVGFLGGVRVRLLR